MHVHQAQNEYLNQLNQQTSNEGNVLQTQLFTDTLPRDTIMGIIRKMSKRPYSAYWQSYVDSKHVVNALKCDGLMKEVAQAMFTELSYEYYPQRARDSPTTGFASLQASFNSDLSRLLLELGPTLRSLAFERSVLYCDLYVEKCLQLRELTIRDWSPRRDWRVLERLLESCGHSLRNLRILGNGQMNSFYEEPIIRHCRALESLSYDDKIVSAKMEQLWKAIGRTLKRLTCSTSSVPRIAIEQLECVGQHCKQLEEVKIRWWLPHVAVARLCKSMGSRLRVLKLEPTRNEFPAQTLREIMNESPDMIVDLAIYLDDEELLRVLGARVRKLALVCSFQISPQFRGTANTLTGLIEMRISKLTSCLNSFQLIQDLFHAPRPNLIKLRVDFVYGIKSQNGVLVQAINVLETVARTVHSLREFECSCFAPLKLSSFEALLQSNKELQRFTVTCLKCKGVTEENLELGIVRLVRSLIQYKSVTEFNVHWPRWMSISNQISNACVPLRGRHLSLIVGDIVYLPKSNSP